MKSYRCDDWNRLAGAKAEIHRRGQLVRAGVVDAVMPDATMRWLVADHNGNRALVESAEGYEVWADPYDLPDELYSSMLSQQPPTEFVKVTPPAYRIGRHLRIRHSDFVAWLSLHAEQ
ncbi:hypothetical protein [Arthrobacter sp. 4R501]|uniref:hypothetical protein n=1 Tax=Arthrobacter sp. 4R501 TaxID=2058886 RepID=UPI0015E2990F|nr:hypothetical protein [Arthrobacter sp. 4R501]